MGVVEHGLGVAAVLMVAQYGMPGYHEFGVGINQLEVRCPKRVGGGGHALEVVYIASGKDAFGTYRLCHRAHEFCDGLLVVVAVAPRVVAHIEIERSFKCLPRLRVLCRSGRKREEKEREKKKNGSKLAVQMQI